MCADVLVTQGARASATMIFTMLDRINSALARSGLKGPGTEVTWCVSTNKSSSDIWNLDDFTLEMEDQV